VDPKKDVANINLNKQNIIIFFSLQTMWS